MIPNTKYLFLGTPEFAAIVLEKLISAGIIPEAVICNPDKPVGRKQVITPPPVKVLAQKNNLPVYQPKNKIELLEVVEKLKPDLGIVAAYGMLLPKNVLDIPKYGFINIHPSLLPKYRGATPIQAAILNGDEKTGVSLFIIEEQMDNGKILAQKELTMANDYNYGTLGRKLFEMGADLLIEILPKYIDGEIIPLLQDDSLATYTQKITTQDAFIKPEDLKIAQDTGGKIAFEIDRKIRALNPEPGVWTMIKDKPFNAARGKRMKILEAALTHESKLKLKKIQYEGKTPVEI